MSSDKIYIPKKKHFSVSTTRRTKTDTTSPFKLSKKDIVLPHIVVHGEYNGVPITVFGEIHNIIDNKFYENIARNKSKNTIFVEHPSGFCDVTKNDAKLLIKNMNFVGSEWIWFNYTIRNKPVVCIDNRFELGLPTANETKLAYSTPYYNNIDNIIDTMIRSFYVFKKDDVIKRFKMTNELETYYNNMITIMKKQFTEFLQENVKYKNSSQFKKIKPMAEIPEHISSIRDYLILNIMKLSAVLVDLNIVDKVKEYTTSNREPIMIFVGAAHAYRLNKFFPQIFDQLDSTIPARHDNMTAEEIIEFIEDMETLIYE